MRMNTLMLRLTGRDAVLRKEVATAKLAPDLRAILEAGIVREHGATYLASLRAGSNIGPFPSASIPDLTGAECFVNHLHVNDHVPEMQARDLLVQAFRYAFELSALLSDGAFRLIVAMSVDDGQFTVRFHERRDGEVWLDEDLDSYAHEAIAVLDTGPRSSNAGPDTSPESR